MGNNGEKYTRRRVRSSMVSTVVSLSLVLFVLGLLAWILLNASRLSNHVKENISLNIMLKENISEGDIMNLKKELDASSFVKSAEYITREEAAKSLQQDLGEDFIRFLGYNPLLPSIEIKLNAAWANNDSIMKMEKQLLTNERVKEVYYQKSLVNVINENLRKIGLVLLAFSTLLAVISIALINNSIRLFIYSRRFLIRTMQLVGATRSFISRPFIVKSLWNGLYSSVITIFLLMLVIIAAQNNIPELIELNDINLFIILFGFVLVMGVAITWLSTWFALRKYLKLQTDELYN